MGLFQCSSREGKHFLKNQKNNFNWERAMRDVENKGTPRSTKVGWGINIWYPLLCLALLHLHDNTSLGNEECTDLWISVQSEQWATSKTNWKRKELGSKHWGYNEAYCMHVFLFIASKPSWKIHSDSTGLACLFQAQINPGAKPAVPKSSCGTSCWSILLKSPKRPKCPTCQFCF